MNFKTTYILFASLIVVLAIFGLTQLLGLQSPKDRSAWVFRSLNDSKKPIRSDDLETVEIVRQGATPPKLLFYRSEQGWKLKEPDVRVDGFQVDRLIDQVIRLRKEEKADVTSNLKQFGLDAPTTTVKLVKKGGDKEWTLNVGKESEGGGEFDKVVYVTGSDRPKDPMAVKRSDLDSVFKNLNTFRSKSLAAESSFDIVRVSLQEPQKNEVLLEKAGEGRWRFDKPPFGAADYEGEPAAAGATTSQSITGVSGLLQAISDLRVETDDDFGPTDVPESELAKKGLEKGKERLRVEVKRQPPGSGEEKKPAIDSTLLIGEKADDKGEKLWARLSNEQSIVKVAAKKVDPLLKVFDRPSALRNRDLVDAESAKIDAVDVKLASGETFKMRKSGDPAAWKVYESGKTFDTDTTAIDGLLNALTTKRQVKDFPEPAKTDAELGLDKPSAVVALWSEGVKKDDKKEEKKEDKTEEKPKDEKKDDKAKGDKKEDKPAEAKKEDKKDPNAEPSLKEDKPTVRLSFGRKDKDVVYVRREVGGEVSRLAVPANLLDKASEGKLAYLDRRLPSFGAVNDVTKLTMVRGSDTFVVNREGDDKSGAKWKLEQPKSLAGRTADTGKMVRLLDSLHNMQAERLVAEKAAPNELERFGLATPAIKATLTLTKPDKKTEDFQYLFGKETDDKLGYYAKQGQRDWVFVAPRSVYDALQGDIQDPTILAFEMAKVKSLKLTGWQEVVGSPFTLDMERKAAASWTVKAPADFKVDSVKVEGFVTGLMNLKAVRFLGRGAPAKPEFKLDLKDGALEIVLFVDGEKEPMTLLVGGPSGSEGFYARSNKIPDEIFVLPHGVFEQVKTKPAYFK